MNTRLLLVTALVLSFGFAALAPTATAVGPCANGPGYTHCTLNECNHVWIYASGDVVWQGC